MSISGISGNSASANVYFDPITQQRNTSSLGDTSTGDTVTFSAEALEMYRASQVDKTTIGENSDEGDSTLQSSLSDEESIGAQAMGGGMKAGGKGGGGKSGEEDDDDEDDDTTSWYDDWFETVYGDESSTEDGLATNLFAEEK